MMATKISDSEALARFPEVLQRVIETGEAVVVERNGEAQVAIVPVADYAAWSDEVDLDHSVSEPDLSLSTWLSEADRVRELIRRELGDRPLPDIDELIDGGRDERDDAIIAHLYRR